MNEFPSGMAAAGSIGIGVIFLRMWRDTSDRFFALFAGAFWVLALNWLSLLWVSPAAEQRHYFYALRLLAFSLIITAIIDKNRSPDDPDH